MSSIVTRRPTLALAAVVALLFAGAAAAGEDGGNGRRIVAIGDIHGAFNGVRSILRETELIDEDDRWIGGNAVLVQTGDILDRGPGATRVAELLIDLQEQATEAGGEVVVLLGNHEVLNLVSDLRDVTKYIVRNLVDAHSEKRLDTSCNTYAAYYRKIAQRRKQKVPKRRELLDRCYAEQPLGLPEYLREIGPEGRIGRWIRTLPVAAEIDGVVFIHGGISPGFAGRGLEELNREVRREIDSLDRARGYLLDQGLILPTSGPAQVVSLARQVVAAAEAGQGDYPHLSSFEHLADAANWLTLREDGPLWFRGYGSWSHEEGVAQLPAILEPLGASHVVVAHTPQKTQSIRPRFDSRVFLIDTGMLTSVYNGRPSALEIEDGRFTAVYVMERTVLHSP